MTRAERLFYRRRNFLWIVATLLFLGGGLALAFLKIEKAEARADDFARQSTQAAAELDRRGDAVSTLATDVRLLRAQIQGEGGTPAAPDPEQAVEDLPDRAEVPVPIPGIPGVKGDKGEPGDPGEPAPVVTPSPGASGLPGTDGVDGKDGADGTNGKDGVDGKDGADGADGQTCPDGYSLQAPPDDPYALVCRQDGAPAEPTPDPGPGPLALDPSRRQYP